MRSATENWSRLWPRFATRCPSSSGPGWAFLRDVGEAGAVNLYGPAYDLPFEALVQDEEGHLANFEKQRDNVKHFGPNYLALQSFGGKMPEASVKSEE